MKYVIIIFTLLIIYFLLNKNFVKDFMSIRELLEFNIKLGLISNAGLIDVDKNNSKLLTSLTSDTILIKFHRRLQNKHGDYIKTYIITNNYNYYIVNPELSKKILNDSPYLFSAGKIKEDFFKKFMPKNLGISKCNTKGKCPWKNRRVFNEKVLGTNKMNPFYDCISNIVKNNINQPLLTVDDFKNVSSKIVADSLYGNPNKAEFIENINNKFVNDSNVMKTKEYQEYKKDLHLRYESSPKCSLLYYTKLNINDMLDVIDDQIPHWTAPFIFMFNYLIPILLCIIINYKDVHKKLLSEIKKEDFDINSKNTFLHYCVIEHIRLFNTININMQRTANKTMDYHGMSLKEGDQIFLLFSSILRNKEEFTDPDYFIPERWESKSIESQDIVFGVGPQKCVSKNITPVYYKSIIYHLLTQYNYKSVFPKLEKKKLYFINPYDIKFSI